MTAGMRVAGTGRLADGSTVIWTVADGRKGRRWREVVAEGDAVRHSLLLETDRERRFSHLELARADGLWTYHLEGDGTLHGNHVARSGEADLQVHHTAGWPFGLDDALIVDGSPISLAAVAWQRSQTGRVGEAAALGVIAIGSETVACFDAVAAYVERISETRWRVGEGTPIEIDHAGLPVLDGTQTRPLELD